MTLIFRNMTMNQLESYLMETEETERTLFYEVSIFNIRVIRLLKL